MKGERSVLPQFVSGDTSWMDQAACAGADTRIFFPEAGQPLRDARAFCARCPVATQCRVYGTVTRSTGVWGGTSEKARTRTRRQPIRHGTPSGYRLHYRRGEKPCDACRQAAALALALSKERSVVS